MTSDDKILILLFSEIKKEILDNLKKHLKNIFKRRVEILRKNLNLNFAFNPIREQYLASLILEELEKFKPSSRSLNRKFQRNFLNWPFRPFKLSLLGKKNLDEKWLAICDFDLYSEGLNFIFGEANIDSGISIISLTRLRQEFYGLPKNEKIFIERIKKEAVHELGHLFYLGHCENKKCVMHFSNSLADTDFKNSDFCQKCKKSLQFHLGKK